MGLAERVQNESLLSTVIHGTRVEYGPTMSYVAKDSKAIQTPTVSASGSVCTSNGSRV
jgi:hypothetical protein